MGRILKSCQSKIYRKNLSICRLLLLSSSSSWDFCWMQSTHIENGSGGIFYHFFKCPTFTFVYVYDFLSCSTFTFFKSAFSPLTLFTSCFLLFTTLIFHQFTSFPVPALFLSFWPSPISLVWSSFKLLFDLPPPPSRPLCRPCLPAKANKSSMQQLLWPQPDQWLSPHTLTILKISNQNTATTKRRVDKKSNNNNNNEITQQQSKTNINKGLTNA